MPITSIVLSGFGKVYTRWVFILYFVYAVVFICFAEEIFKNEKGKIIILLAITVNICVNLVKLYGINGENWNDEFVAFSDVYKYTDSPVNESKAISGDGDIYRIANDTYMDINGRPENTAMINGYNGLNFWFSIINGNVQRMIDQIGTSKKTEWRSYGLNNITIYETMAGVKYYLNKGNSVEKAGYECIEEVRFGDECWKVYKNENALPLISIYDECITEDFYNQLNELEKVEAVARYIALDNGCINSVRSIEPSLIYELDTVKERNGQNMSVECYAGDGEIYFELGLNNLHNKMGGFILNNNENLLYKGNGNKRTIYNIGTGFAGEKLSFSMELGELTAEEADMILEQTKVYVMDGDKYEKTIWERNELGESDICISNNKIKIEDIHLNEAKWMMLALPYSSNWKCYVDDKETNIYKGNTMYMVVRLEEGEHEIMFEYRGISFYIGIISGLISLCIMLVKTKIMSA